MKNVLMIAQSIYDFDPRIIRFTNALIEQNFQVEIICLRYKHQTKFEIVNGVKVHRIMKVFSQNKISSYIFYSLIFTFRALIKCTLLTSGKNKPDFIHVHNMPDYLVFTTLIPKMRKIPVILDMHDLTVELFKEKWSAKKFNKVKFLLTFVEKISCAYVDHVITVTRECVDILVSRGLNPSKISLILNSADENVFCNDSSELSEDKKFHFKILYHGTIAKRFGLHYFINAMPDIMKSIPDIEFHIYGKLNDYYAVELQNLIENLNLKKNVIFKDPIPYSEVNEMIKSYDLGVVTYELTEYMNLALPTKACEYASSGLPFIISKLISVQSIFRNESVLYVDPENEKMISDTVMEFYKNPIMGSTLAKNAVEDVSKISWSKMKLKYLDLIQYKLNIPNN